MSQTVNADQARLIAHNISSYGHALQIAQSIGVGNRLRGLREINEADRAELKDHIRAQIIKLGVEHEQEAIYRFMGDICTDAINKQTNN